MEAACQRVTSEKNQIAAAYQKLLSVKETLEMEIEMLKGRRGVAGGPEVRLWESGAILCEDRLKFEVLILLAAQSN